MNNLYEPQTRLTINDKAVDLGQVARNEALEDRPNTQDKDLDEGQRVIINGLGEHHRVAQRKTTDELFQLKNQAESIKNSVVTATADRIENETKMLLNISPTDETDLRNLAQDLAVKEK